MTVLKGSLSESLWNDLRTIIRELREDGGLMSPSVYDTAQALRFCPPTQGAERTVAWLLEQQHNDGGWGNPAAPRTRDLPTLAAILALHSFRNTFNTLQVAFAIRCGLSFLRRQARYWQGPLPDDIPVGVEVILPRLLEDAAEIGLEVPHEQYANLVPLSRRKRQQIVHLNPGAGTPFAFSWEAWGTMPDPCLLDDSGGVGHNPAATAYWIKLASAYPQLADEVARARTYLRNAARATGSNIPGVMPTAWPIDRYEQSFVLHTLSIAGLLDHPRIADVVRYQLQDMLRGMQPGGIGFSDYFTPDGDDTAAALAALKAAGFDCDISYLDSFRSNGHVIGYHGELQASHSLTARAMHAMSLFGEDTRPLQMHLLKHQLPDGRWPGDKWHTAWTYATLLGVYALKDGRRDVEPHLELAVDAIEMAQNLDGGWGPDGCSTTIDTAYAVLALAAASERVGVAPYVLRQAQHWLLDHYRPFDYHCEPTWLNKQQYTPYRIDWAFILCAMLVLDGMTLHDKSFNPIPETVSVFA